MVSELEEETSNAEEGQVMSRLSAGKAGTLMQLCKWERAAFCGQKLSERRKEEVNGEIG